MFRMMRMLMSGELFRLHHVLMHIDIALVYTDGKSLDEGYQDLRISYAKENLVKARNITERLLIKMQ